jgi:large subunit ribosomal protein L18
VTRERKSKYLAKQNYIQIFRRRRVGKTDYRKRRGIIQGQKPFLSVRVSNRYISGQIMRPAPEGDITVCSESSRSLAKQHGWKGSMKNLPSSYLTGYLLGKSARQKGIEDAVFYSGVSRFVHGSRLAAFLKGASEAGLGLEYSDDILPDEQRIKGNHIADYAKKLSSESTEKYKEYFSKVIASGLKPEEYVNHFEQVRDTIEK